MIKVKTLFTKTKNIAIFFRIFKLQDFQLPMSDYALILSVFSSISPVQGWPPGNQSIISYLSLPRLNTIVKKTWKLFGQVSFVGLFWASWICLNPNSIFFFIDLTWKLSLWINCLQIIQIVVPNNFLQIVLTGNSFAELANCYSGYFFLQNCWVEYVFFQIVVVDIFFFRSGKLQVAKQFS